MGITKTELAEAVAKAIKKEFGSAAAGAKLPFSERLAPEGFLKPRGKKYAEMFPEENLHSSEFNSFEEFLTAAYEGRDSRLKTLSEGTDSSGGFVVEPEYAALMLDKSLESEIMRPRCLTYSMKSNSRKVPALEIGSHSTHLYGGVVGGFIAEGGTMTAGEPKFRQMELVAKKLYTYAVSSTEIFEDGAKFEETLGRSLTMGLGWYLDYYLINGTGSGQPLGLKNCPCAIEVAIETNQPADTILAENIWKMQQALHAPCWANALWIAHPTCYTQLRGLSMAVGTGGNVLPMLTKTGNQFTLADMPLIFTEKSPGVVGDAADLILFDPTQYAIGIRSGLRLEKSNAPNFTTDKLDMRCILRVDGQSTWEEALTLKDGSTTASCIVKLAERA